MLKITQDKKNTNSLLYFYAPKYIQSPYLLSPESYDNHVTAISFHVRPCDPRSPFPSPLFPCCHGFSCLSRGIPDRFFHHSNVVLYWILVVALFFLIGLPHHSPVPYLVIRTLIKFKKYIYLMNKIIFRIESTASMSVSEQLKNQIQIQQI